MTKKIGSNRPLTKEEWASYWAASTKQEKAEYLQTRTYTVLFKILCNACDLNAREQKRIVIDCPNCRIIKWHNCSIRQVQNGELKTKITALFSSTEWIKAYDHSRAEKWNWKRHEAQYNQDVMGRWYPK